MTVHDYFSLQSLVLSPRKRAIHARSARYSNLAAPRGQGRRRLCARAGDLDRAGRGLLLWTLAYQVPYTHRLDLGGNLQTGRRYDDTPFLDNFNDPEPNPIPDHATLLYRWSRADLTIVFPGIGGGRWQSFLYPALCLGAGPALGRTLAAWPRR